MMRRFDEILCQKAEKTALREHINEATSTFITKADSQEATEQTASDLKEFREKVEEMDKTVKWQAKQI